MGKTRMGLLDLQVQVRELQTSIVGSRVANIYDVNSRTFIFKLSVPPYLQARQNSASNERKPLKEKSWKKVLLLIESGARIHLTQFERGKGNIPSGLCLKLRKHIRTKRLDSLKQLSGDRVIDLTFGAGRQSPFHVIAEFYAGGNIILTDHEYTTLTFLRTIRRRISTSTHKVACQRESELLKGSVESNDTRDSDGRALHRKPISSAPPIIAVGQKYRSAENRKETNVSLARIEEVVAAELPPSQHQASRRRRRANSAKSHLASKLGLGPQVIVHGLVSAGFDANAKLSDLAARQDTPQKLYDALQPIIELLKEVPVPTFPLKGYVFFDDAKARRTDAQQNVTEGTSVPPKEGAVDDAFPYSDFSPYLLAQHQTLRRTEFKTFDEAVDAYFAKLEAVMKRDQLAKKEKAAIGRVEKLSKDLRGRVEELERAQVANERMAQAILANIDEVDLAIAVLRSALVSAVDWESLSVMIEEEKEKGNPAAEIIHSLNLDKNQVTLMLENSWSDLDDESASEAENDRASDSAQSEDSGEDGNDLIEDGRRVYQKTAATRKVLLVPVDLGLSAYANANQYFDKRKTAATKKSKAAKITGRTIRAAEQKMAAETQKLKAEAAASSIRAKRKVFWFEKFLWMVSSENFLIVAGRDAQQNEILVKRYMAQADVYVHADVHGAASVIVKNAKRPGQKSYHEIPKMTLEEAGAFAMCRSSAWDAKITTSAWWVRAGQVSKTAPTGEYLSTGSFVIRGSKNFLDPCQLVMGFGFLFKIDESSVVNHRTERRIRGESAEEELGNDTEGSRVEPVVLPSQDFAEEVHIVGDDVVESEVADAGLMQARQQTPRTYPAQLQQESDVQIGAGLEEDASLFAKFAGVSMAEFSADASVEGKIKETNVPKAHQDVSSRGAGAFEESRGAQTVGSDLPVSETTTGPIRAVKADKKQKQRPLPRGKRSKLKRMKKKYRDQDENERAIALAALGTRPIKEMAVTQSSGQPENQIDEKETVGREKGPPKPSRREKREVMRLMEEEGIIELTNLEKESLTTLDMLTANPVPEDIVQFALPVCAPYNALSGYRYRVKLLPGNMKRGKAYREAVFLFIRNANKALDKCKQERDALRLVPESEAIQAMLGSVRVVAPGLAQIQAANKRKKKQKGKKKG